MQNKNMKQMKIDPRLDLEICHWQMSCGFQQRFWAPQHGTPNEPRPIRQWNQILGFTTRTVGIMAWIHGIRTLREEVEEPMK